MVTNQTTQSQLQVPYSRYKAPESTMLSVVLTKGLEDSYAKIHESLIDNLAKVNAYTSSFDVPLVINEQELLWSLTSGVNAPNRSKIVECAMGALYRDYKTIPTEEWKAIAIVYKGLEKDAPNDGKASSSKIALPPYLEPFYRDIAVFIQANKIAIPRIMRGETVSTKIINTIAVIYLSRKIK